jgi:hypothetical protein
MRQSEIGNGFSPNTYIKASSTNNVDFRCRDRGYASSISIVRSPYHELDSAIDGSQRPRGSSVYGWNAALL